MATGGDRFLSDADIAGLARSVSAGGLESIAEGFLGIEPETIANLRRRHREDVEAFNRDVIRTWAYKPDNSGPDQVQKLASLLYKAAGEGSYINARKVEEILGISPERTEAPIQESDILELAEELQLDAEDDMKIEMAPWAKTNIRMDKLYTNLEVDQIEDQPSGKPEYKRLGDYKELFPEGTARKGRGKRILVKGDPGSGKTTFAKKIMWDWGKGIFTAASVVFFVSMKFVRPGDAVENIIIQQTPALEGLSVTQKRLRMMLDTFGVRFLIILDGFDENNSDSNNNDDVMRLLRGQKFRRCNILLTSRPHTVAQIEDCFHVVLQIQGFTKDNARKFSSQVLRDQTKIKDVLEIRCLNAGEYIQKGDSVYTCPILLLFICILTNHNEIDLTQKVFSVGEIYARLVRCLYRKYAVRKGKEFKQVDFVEVLLRVGSVATFLLTNPQPCYLKSDINKEVGDDAFEYGLLIGYEDFRLLADETADIVIDFPHRTIQEFIAAFFCVEGAGRREYEKFSTLRQNILSLFPLALHFFLWLLGKDVSQSRNRSIFDFDGREEIYKAIETSMRDKIDSLEVQSSTISMVHPSLDVESAYKARDELRLNFLRDVLSKCTKVRRIWFGTSQVDCIEWLMQSIRPLSSQLSLVHFDQNIIRSSSRDLRPSEYISVVIQPLNNSYLNEVLKHLTKFEKPLSVTCVLKVEKEKWHISQWPTEATQFHILAEGWEINVPQNISHSPSLTHLSLRDFKLTEAILSAFSNALQNHRLPELSHLDFRGSDIKGKLSNLLTEQLKAVTHLNLNKCFLDPSDIQALHRMDTVTPNLKSFTLFLGDRLDDSHGPRISPLPLPNMYASVKWVRDIDEALFSVLQAPWPSLTELWLHEANKDEYKEIVTTLNTGKFPELKQLGITMWKHVDIHKDVQVPIASHTLNAKKFQAIRISAETEHLEPVNVKALTHLTLHRFICTMQHLHMVTQSKILMQLHKLDISHSSGITGFLQILLGHNMRSLHSLRLSDCGLISKDLSSLAEAKLNCRLPDLKHLDISQNEEIAGSLECLFAEEADWTQLKSLNALQNTDKSLKSDFECVAKRAHSGYLKSLSELHIATTDVEILSQGKWEKLEKIVISTKGGPDNNILRDVAEAHRKRFLAALLLVRVNVEPVTFEKEMKDVLSEILQPYVTDVLLYTRCFVKILQHLNNMTPAILETVRKSNEIPNTGAFLDMCAEELGFVSLLNSELPQPMSEEQEKKLNDLVSRMFQGSATQSFSKAKDELLRQGVLVEYNVTPKK